MPEPVTPMRVQLILNGVSFSVETADVKIIMAASQLMAALLNAGVAPVKEK